MATTKTDRSEPAKNFQADIRERLHLSDLALMGTVPLVLTAIHLLPASIQQLLVLDYASPSLVNLWTAAYVHRGFSHFSSNLLAYCMYVGPAHLFFVLAGERRLFRYIFGSFLVVLPPVLSVVNITLIGQGSGAGFSGIAAAFVGLLPAAIFVFIQNRVSSEIGPSKGVPVFLLLLSGVAATYSGIVAAASILVFAAFLTVFDVYMIGFEEVRTAVSDLVSMEGHFLFILFAVVLLLVAPGALFPQEIIQNGQPVNILSHYAGLVLGFFGPTAFPIGRD